MQQFSIKNDQASKLLDKLTKLTGQGKTETIIKALELYESSLLKRRTTAEKIEHINQHIHPFIKEEYRGKAPTKEEIEEELGMP